MLHVTSVKLLMLAFVDGVILNRPMVLDHTHISRSAFTDVDVVGIEFDARLDSFASRMVVQFQNSTIEAHLYCKLLYFMVKVSSESMVTIVSAHGPLLFLVLAE